MVLKYAYPNEENLGLYESRRNIQPYREDEIEIVKLTKTKLLGNLVDYRHTRLGELDIKDVEKQFVISKKMFGFFGKEYKVVEHGWVRMKKRTKVELDLNNRIITKIFDGDENGN